MSDLPYISQRGVLGMEGTPGDPSSVPTYRRIKTVGLLPGPQIPRNRFTPVGARYPATIPPGKNWSATQLQGVGSYNELLFFLAMMWGAPTTTTAGTFAGGTIADHTWAVADGDIIVPKTGTLRRGNATRAFRTTYNFCPELSYALNRDAVSINGQLAGFPLQDNVALPGTIANVPLGLILPQHWRIYSDPTLAAIGTTKLTRTSTAEVRFTNVHGPYWALDADQVSFSTVANLETGPELMLTLQADSTGMQYYADAQVGDRRYLRLEAVGPTISGTLAYRHRLDFACEVLNLSPFQNDQGLNSLQVTLGAVVDDNWGNGLAWEGSLRNVVPTL